MPILVMSLRFSRSWGQHETNSSTIDGPASSGKSTVAKIIAKDLDYTYLDTGAMYRAATYLALQNNLTAEQVDDLLAL